jgi:hypothetical protein
MASMLHVFAGVMFERPPSLFGIPLSVLSFVIGIAGMVVAFILFRRTVAGEGEYRSFRATSRREPSTTILIWGLVTLGFAVLAVVSVVLALQKG